PPEGPHREKSGRCTGGSPQPPVAVSRQRLGGLGAISEGQNQIERRAGGLGSERPRQGFRPRGRSEPRDCGRQPLVDLPHQDPADRFIAATAQVRGFTLITSDAYLLKCSGIRTLTNRSIA